MPDAPSPRRRLAARAFLPSLACAFGLMAGLDVVAHAATLLSVDGDPALHMLIGRIILAGHALPASDPTSVVTRALPLVDHEWLAQVTFGAAERVLGLAGPVLVAAGVVGATLAVAARELRRRGVAPWTLLAVLAPAYLTMRLHLGVRPHVFGWLLTLGVFLALERWRTGRLGARRLALFGVPLFVLWANVHGSFVLGLGLVALAFASEALKAIFTRRHAARWVRARRLAALGVAFGLATLVNPYGWRLVRALAHFAGERFVFATTADLAPPDFALPETHLLLATLIGSFVLCALGRKRAPLFHWLVLGALAALTLHSVRSGSLFALVAAVVVGPRLQALLDRAARSSRRWAAAARGLARSNARLDRTERDSGGWALAAIAGALLIVAGAKGALPARFDPALQPVGAARFVAEHPARFTGQMYNAFHWGGYLAWRFYPKRVPYLHGLNFEYGARVQRAYFGVQRVAPGWQTTLAQSGARWVIWPAKTPLARALARSKDWRRAYADRVAVIFVRRKGRG